MFTSLNKAELERAVENSKECLARAESKLASIESIVARKEKVYEGIVKDKRCVENEKITKKDKVAKSLNELKAKEAEINSSLLECETTLKNLANERSALSSDREKNAAAISSCEAKINAKQAERKWLEDEKKKIKDEITIFIKLLADATEAASGATSNRENAEAKAKAVAEEDAEMLAKAKAKVEELKSILAADERRLSEVIRIFEILSAKSR